MNDATSKTPVRLITRHALEFHLSSLAALNRLVTGADDDAVIALVVLRVCLPDWFSEDELIKPVSIERSSSVLAIANSMGRSYASVHRLVAGLLADRLLVRHGKAVALSNEGDAVVRVITFLEESHDLLVRFAQSLNDASALKSAPLSSRSCHGPLTKAMIATALDMMLMPYEVYRDQIGNWTAKKLWLALSTMTTRHITEDAELDRFYAVRSTPNERRKSVSRHTLAKLAFVPPSSAWRHLRALAENGVISERDDGWVLLTNNLLEEQMERSTYATAAFYLRHFDELIALGLDAKRLKYAIAHPAFLQP